MAWTAGVDGKTDKYEINWNLNMFSLILYNNLVNMYFEWKTNTLYRSEMFTLKWKQYWSC